MQTDKYFTQSNVDITHRIEEGRTLFFTTSQKEEAKFYAKQQKSYVYEVFTYQKNNKVLAGYGVPK
ncbi:hypothetical protein [Aquimarina spongiae]|uniref:Uncharacterized protein n=1 Tax=Aquimarina spongiae TaxID=570521 RepID=A0A1M6JDZ3_9FLAO|nr:hypothetical protein [Aquimarina spongiae]SHJ44959.1 hypothetical protein SAMN04488508_10916 [Aquimarina spongiae]